MKDKEVAIIIPSYQPHKEIMLDFMERITKHFEHIIVIDDGSGKEYSEFYKKIEELGVDVIKHNINLGKGRGMKNAFNYCLNKYPNVIGAVTADCDGQHYIKDIIKCSNGLKQNPEKLIIGVRNFDDKNIPFRSRFGNKLTRLMFGIFVGIKITDTQTGLRGYSTEIMKKFLETRGERYEYETNMLIECKQKEIAIEEIPITTVYINKNELSHFNPIKDSIMIYKLFVKYIISAVSSFLIDLILFTILVSSLPKIDYGIITTIVVSSIIARIVSSIYNFFINAKLVFKNKTKSSIIKYCILVIVQMLVSAFAVSFIFEKTSFNSSLIKVIVDSVIFVVNFVIQREWVFKVKSKKDKNSVKLIADKIA